MNISDFASHATEITVDGAVRRTGLSPFTIRRWLGSSPGLGRKRDGRWWIDTAALDALLAQEGCGLERARGLGEIRGRVAALSPLLHYEKIAPQVTRLVGYD